jgi:CRISPR system Cascade subunit CasB
MSQEHPFITYLETLAEDRAALAALRRGLGQPPGTVPEMYPYVVRRLPNEVYPGSWDEQTYYLVAALYGLHPDKGSGNNLGAHFAQTLNPNPDYNEAIERRFTALLTSHPDDLHFYLRQAISYLKSKEVPVNWHQLMWDVRDWGHPDRQTRVQKRWAAQFWRIQKQENENTQSTEI